MKKPRLIILSNIHYLNINNRAFNAINEERKKIEIRANKKGRIDYSAIESNDCIVFKDQNSSDLLVCKVVRKKWYASVRALLETEGTKYTLSSTNSIDEGVTSIESIADYKDVIAKNGVYAIVIEKMSNVITKNAQRHLTPLIETYTLHK